MDKKGLFAILLAVAALVTYQVHHARQMAEFQKAKAAWDAKVAQEKASADPAPAATVAIEAVAAPASATPPADETLETMRTDAAEYVFTNLGGGLARATLLDHRVSTKSDAKVVLNEFGKIPVGAVSDAAGEKTGLAFTATRDDSAGTITYERTDERQLSLAKKFTLPRSTGLKGRARLREEYLLKLDLTFTNRSPQPLTLPAYWLHAGSVAPLHEVDSGLFIGLNYVQDSSNHFTNIDWFAPGGMLFWKRGERLVYPESPQTLENVRWAAVQNQYFTQLITPLVDPKAMIAEQKKQRGIGVWAKRFPITPEQWSQAGREAHGSRALHGLDGALAMPGLTLEPGASATRSFEVLAGPSEYRRLREFNDYQAELLDFGMFGWISKGLLNSLNALKGWLGSYWAAIVVLTICIRTAMWPLQNRATQTAKKMAALSPKLKELQERYKDDPMRMQQETGKLWKMYGINPLGGCLPLLVQIPIFFGFYNMLNKAVELRNNGFLWVEDLSQPDTVARLAGIPINILPLVMAVTMVVQMMLTPKAGDPMQQRIMMFMPLVFIALCYNYAAALALYWTVQNIFSIFQLFVTRNQQPVTLEPVIVEPPPSKPKAKRR
jgi:YidC/Oxa1 family membrane protein insertase